MSKRKLGSSRRSKGKQLVKDQETEPHLESREDFENEMGGSKNLETQVSAATRFEIQEDFTRDSKHGVSKMNDKTSLPVPSPDYSVRNITSSPVDVQESLIPETDHFQTQINSKLEKIDESSFIESQEVEVNTPTVGPSDALKSSISSCASVNQQQKNKHAANSSMQAAAMSESNKKNDTFRQDGGLQGNHMGSESQISSVGLESITPEITTDKSSPSENTEIKLHVEQDARLLPKEELPSKEEHDVFAQSSKDGVNKVHDENDKPVQWEELISGPADEQANTGFSHTGNRRKFGSRRRNKGQRLKESEEEVLDYDEDDQALNKEKILETSSTNQEELSEKAGPDVLLSVSSSHFANVHSSKPENYAETDLENFICKSENLPDHHDVETEMNLDLFHKAAEVLPEEVDKCDTVCSEDPRCDQHSYNVRKVQEDTIYATQVQEIPQTNDSHEAVTDNASENPDISGGLMNRFEMTNRPDPTEEITGDSATKQEVLTLVVTQKDFPTTEIDLEAGDQTNNDDHVQDFRQTCIINTECIKTTVGQINQNIKHNSGQRAQQYEDHVTFERQTSYISPQTLPAEFPDSSECIDEQALTGLSQTGNTRISHSEDAVDKVQDDQNNPAQMQEFLQNDCSSETLPDGASVLAEITESEFTVESTDDSTTKVAASNPKDKTNEYSKHDIAEALDQRNEDYELHGVNKLQPGDVENSPPSHVHEFKSRDEDNVEPKTDDTFYQDKEGPQYETEEIKPGDCKPKDSSMNVDEKSHADSHHSSSKRKLGSSRRNKGKYKAKESVIEAYRETIKDADVNSSGNESSEAVLTGQKTSVEVFQEEEENTGASQAEVVGFDTPTCTVSKERLEPTELLSQDGNLQNYLLPEQLPITQGVHSETSSSGKHTEDECTIEKRSLEDGLSTKEEHGQETEPTHIQDMSYNNPKTEENREDVDAEIISGDMFDHSEFKDIKQSRFEKAGNELGDVCEVKDPEIMMKLGDDEVAQPVKEGLFSETGDTGSPLQSLQYETHAVLDLNPGGNSEAVNPSQEKSTETKLEGMDKSSTSHTDNMAVHGKYNVHSGTVAGICEFTTSSSPVKQQLIKSKSKKLPDDTLPSVSTAENDEPDEDAETSRPCENLQSSHLSNENIDFPIPPERSTKKSSQKEPTEAECSIEQENYYTNDKQDEYFSSSKAERVLLSEEASSRNHDEHINQAQTHHTNYTIITEEKPPLQTLQSDTDQTPLDPQPRDSSLSFKDESHSSVKLGGNRRKLGSTRRDKTKQQAKTLKANQDSKDGVVEDVEMLAENTTKQEELEDAMLAEKISCTMSEDELQNVTDNSTVATSNINPGSDNGDFGKFYFDERHTELVKEPDNVSQLTGYGTVNLMQSPQVCARKDDSDMQSILYPDDIISPRSSIVHVLDHTAACQCQSTEELSGGKDPQGQEVHLQQTDDVMETVRCVTIEDCKTEVESSMDAQGPEQDKAGEKHVHTVQEEDASQESTVDTSYKSRISTPVDVHHSLQEKTQSDYNEKLQEKSKEKRRKMGSTRKTRLNRKQDKDTDSSKSDFNTEAEVGDLDKLEVVEELSSSAELLEREYVKPQQDELPSCASNTESNETNVIPAVLSEQPASIDPVAFEIAAEERNEDKISQLDFTNTEVQLTSGITGTSSSTLSQLMPPNTETNTGINMQTHVESVKPAQVQDADEQKPSSLHEEAQCKNLEIKNPSPDLSSPNRRRKLGSTRRDLSSRTRRDDQQQELEDKATEIPMTSEDILAESASQNEDKVLQLHAEHGDSDPDLRKNPFSEAVEIRNVGEALSKPMLEETPKESPISQPEVTEPEQHLNPGPESTSHQSDTLSELVSDGRRRKFGSNRKSRLHQSNTEQTAREARTFDDQNEEKDGPKTTEERREESPSLHKRSEVGETDEKVLNISISKSARGKTAAQSGIRFGQEGQGELSLANPRETDLRSNCYNVVMVGDSSVGKTSFMKRAQSGKFSLDLPASVGLDSCMWTVVVEGKPVVLQLWDTAGQERFRSITRQIFHKAQAFLLMYDITSSQSFSAVSYWANSIQEAAAEDVTVLLLGNKCDHARRQVKSEQGEILAKEYNYEFLECSAATGENVVQALEIVARMLSHRADLREEATALHKEPVQKKRSTCC